MIQNKASHTYMNQQRGMSSQNSEAFDLFAESHDCKPKSEKTKQTVKLQSRRH